MNGGPGPPLYPSSHHMRLPGPPQGRMPTAQPRHNGQQYPTMMQPQLQRQVSVNTLMFHCLEFDTQMQFDYFTAYLDRLDFTCDIVFCLTHCCCNFCKLKLMY